MARLRVARPRTDFALVVLVIGLFFLAETAAVLVATDGHFTYPLDDPYIHLALSEQIRHGHYGINPGEVATPSSSVLWPFLLAATAGTVLHAATPLVLDLVATIAIGWLLLRLLAVVTDGASRRRPGLAAFLAAGPILLLNWGGVAFTGMEHSTHIAASLAVGVGLVEVATTGTARWWLTAGLLLGPSLRYEGLAVTVAAAAVLFWWGRRRTALLAVLVAVLPLVAFSLIASANGLDPLPSSVLIKSGVARGGGFGSVAGAVADAVRHPLFAVLLAGLIGSALVRRRVTALHWYAFGVLAAHAVGGRFGWFGRYELYAYAAVLPVVAFLARRPLTALFTARDGWRRAAAGAVVTLAVTSGYVETTVLTPVGSADIYTQQAQMARFVSDYWRRPVAVNDLGLVADRGGQYVLDLWGLASQEAREARAAGDGAGWMRRLTDEHGVELVMIYEDWFPQVPSSWTRVAVLTMDLPRITSARRRVSFFATSPRAAGELRDALRDFAPTLPAHADLGFPAGTTP